MDVLQYSWTYRIYILPDITLSIPIFVQNPIFDKSRPQSPIPQAQGLGLPIYCSG